MEEVKVDLHLCEGADRPVHAWGRAEGVVFRHDIAADQWANVEELGFRAPVTCRIRGMQIFYGQRLLTYFPLGSPVDSGGYLATSGDLISVEPGGIVCHAGTATAAYMELASTLSAIDQSQEFEVLRRQLMGAVEEGRLWLR